MTPVVTLAGAGAALQGPAYWDRARRALMRADPVLAGILRAHPRIRLVPRGDPFLTLARSIVGQQISVRVAQAVWDRTVMTLGQVSPAAVLRTPVGQLRASGLSARKAEYLADLAGHFDSGRLRPADWPALADEDVIRLLVEVRGIGRWTAEMFLMFNLMRPDVLPLDDVGLQRAVALHYFRGRRVAARTIARTADCWRPWRSVATWYLWRSLEPVPVSY